RPSNATLVNRLPSRMLPAKVAGMSFAVLVIDMAHTGDEDGSSVVDGFASFEAARAYAEARTRASLEELRGKDQPAAARPSRWHLYGGACRVMGGGFGGRDRLDDYIARPASAAECDWPRLAPARSASRQDQSP